MIGLPLQYNDLPLTLTYGLVILLFALPVGDILPIP